MSPRRRLLATAGVALLALAAAVTLGCGGRGTTGATVDQAAVERDVRSLLDRWVRAFESRDADAVRSILAADDRFVWLEDGEARYRSADDVVRALACAAAPPGTEEAGTIHRLS